MTDLEKIKKCAEKMDFDFFEIDDRVRIAGRYAIQDDYDPLNDDAQAMALVKKFDLNFEKFPGSQWQADRWNGREWTESVFSDDLNRAICECVAKMKGSS